MRDSRSASCISSRCKVSISNTVSPCFSLKVATAFGITSIPKAGVLATRILAAISRAQVRRDMLQPIDIAVDGRYMTEESMRLRRRDEFSLDAIEQQVAKLLLGVCQHSSKPMAAKR